MSSAAEPTLMGEEFPAVTEPPTGSNAAGSNARASAVVSRRMH